MVNKGKYKISEVGEVPEDWDVITLGDNASIYRGGSPRPIQNYLTEAPNGVNWIKIGDVRADEKFISGTAERIIPEGAVHSREVHKGDFILSNSMSFGRPYILEIDGCIHDGWLVVQKYQKAFERMFLYYVLCSEATMKQYKSMAAGSSVQNLNKEKVEEIKIAHPMIKEQKEIAEALSDIDNLITSLQKLIDKKKAVKQGAMQELLTGKRRLLGFDQIWEKKFFGDVFEFMPTNSLTREQMGAVGTVKNIHYGDILTRYGAYLDADDSTIPVIIDENLVGKYNNTVYVQSGDIIIADTAEDNTVGKAVELIHVKCRMLSGQHTMLCRPRGKFAERFLGYYINSVDFHNQMIPYITGIKVSSISKASLLSLEMYIPPVEEQTAIAQILTDMDIEIEQLEKKLAKYQQIRQGMMQELLTGHIRLIDDVEET